ncbi:MAG TPA: LysM peptidoglycan-binding domain-containing protein [Stellaceae bacterium]|jgi:LysM repeat protein|nr:LysM peptidoglycan-binding domain-containing protein [Stellaceae bacterium]
MKNRMLRAAAVIAVAGAVAACAMEMATPVASNDAAPNAAEESAPVPPPATAGRREAEHIVVEPGGSVSRIAAKYGVPKEAIIEANHLEEPYKIKTGQRLLIPGSGAAAPSAVARRTREIVVEAGRSVGGIAAEYKVPKSAIIEANRLEPPYKLKTGQKLLVPGAAEPPPIEVVAASPPPAIAPADGPPSDRSAASLPQEPSPAIAARAESATSPPPSAAASAQPSSADTSTAEPALAAAMRKLFGAADNPPVAAEPLPAPAAPAPTVTADPPASSRSGEPPASATAAATPPPTPVPAAAPPGVICPPGTTGMMSEDVIKQPVFICRRVRPIG